MKRLLFLFFTCCAIASFPLIGCSPQPSPNPKAEKKTDAAIADEKEQREHMVGEWKNSNQPKEQKVEKQIPEPKVEKKLPEPNIEKKPEQAKQSIQQIIAMVCEKTAEAYCKPLFTCCKSSSLKFKNKQDCKTQFVKRCSYQKTGTAHITFRRDNLQKCLQLINDAGKQCTEADPLLLQRECKQIYLDDAKVGQPCAPKRGDFHCADGAGRCKQISSGVLSCFALKDLGESCQKVSCKANLKCLLSKNQAKLSCEKPRQSGGFCGRAFDCVKGLTCLKEKKCGKPLSEGESCTQQEQCAASLSCNGKCTKRVALGEACEGHFRCPKQSKCIGFRTESRCAEKKEKGDPCYRSSECKIGLSCSNKICKTLLKQGETCDRRDQCASGSNCDLDKKKCVALLKEGETCSSRSAKCAEPLSCFGSTGGKGTCKKRAKNGESCTSKHCIKGFICKKGMCAKRPTVGTKCQYLCHDSFCNHKTHMCIAFRKLGEPCKANIECGLKAVCVPKGKGSKLSVCGTIPQKEELCWNVCGQNLSCKSKKIKGICSSNFCKKAIASK